MGYFNLPAGIKQDGIYLYDKKRKNLYSKAGIAKIVSKSGF
jgi:hypothetical protein